MSQQKPFIAELDPRRNLVRDEGGISTGVAILGAAACLVVGGVIAGKIGPEAVPTNTAPGATAPGGENPTVPGGTPGNTVTVTAAPGSEIDPTVPPATTQAPAAPAAPESWTYAFKAGSPPIDKVMPCVGEVETVTAVKHPKSGQFSLWLGVDEAFPGDQTLIRSQNETLALDIVIDSGALDPDFAWNTAAADFDINNLHAPGKPNEPGQVALMTGCSIDGEPAIPKV